MAGSGNFGTNGGCCALATPGISENTAANYRLPWLQFHTSGAQEAFIRLAESKRVFEFADNRGIGVDLAVMNPYRNQQGSGHQRERFEVLHGRQCRHRDHAAYIEENRHLPEIPSEAEVRDQGVSLGAMQSKLLAKVEELTLHAIRLEQENRAPAGEDRETGEAHASGRAVTDQQ